MATSKLVAECRRSARYWHGWLERGDSSTSEADAVFTDTTLQERLANPLNHFNSTAPSASSAFMTSDADQLPPRAAELAKRAAETLCVSAEVASDLVRLYKDERLSSYCVLHHQSSNYDLLDLRPETAISELSRLLHSEKCEILEVIQCVLRFAHDDRHEYVAQCHELSYTIMRNGLRGNLWQLFKHVSSCLGAASTQAEMVCCIQEVLDLQLRILDCLVLVHYDPELYRPENDEIKEMKDYFLKQRFLGALYRAAGAHDAAHQWLLGEGQIFEQAKCVGDLCLALILQCFALEDLFSPSAAELGTCAAQQHKLFGSVSHARSLHRHFSNEWVDVCETAAGRRSGSASAVTVHCAHMASLTILGWAAAITAAPTLRDMHNLDRIVNSTVFRSPHLVEDAVASILRRGFLVQDTTSREHAVVRAVLRPFVAASASSFLLHLRPSLLVATSRLMYAAHAGEALATQQFWEAEYRSRQGCYWVISSWLENFPLGLAELLPLIGGLGGSPEDPTASSYAIKLLRAPLQAVVLPFNPSRPVVALNSSSGFSPLGAGGFSSAGSDSGTVQVVLQEPVYLEEIALRALGLPLPEWHVDSSVVLQPGTQGSLIDPATMEGGQNPSVGGRGRRVRWALRSNNGVSIWRLALASWDAALEALGFTQPPASNAAGAAGSESAAGKMLIAVVRCACELLIVCPENLFALCSGLPGDDCQATETAPCDGLFARLLASLHACASLGAVGSTLPLILHALGVCASARSKEPSMPPYAVLLRLLEPGSCHRFRHGDASTLVAVLSTRLDYEREQGVYPVTTAALTMIEALLKACSMELFALPYSAHAVVPFLNGEGSRPTPPRGTVAVDGRSSQSIEILGTLTDFTFGLCFARCNFWSCRTSSDRYQLMLACVRIATALMPALECFNWATCAGVASSGVAGERSGEPTYIRSALQWLRMLQFRALRSWSEATFVSKLLQLICCDVTFGPVGTNSSQYFMGLCSPAMEQNFQVSFTATHSESVYATTEFANGTRVLVGALECLHGLLSLVLRPGGIAPDYLPLARHLLALSTDREPLSTQPVNRTFGGVAATVPQRADLVQSLYGLMFARDSVVACWAARIVTSLCVLWSHTDLHPQPAGVPGDLSSTSHKPQLIAFLSVPPRPADALNQDMVGGNIFEASGVGCNAKPTFLSTHLARHLLEVLQDPEKDIPLRCSCADLARVAMQTQPGLFLDEANELLSKAVVASGLALADVISRLKVDGAPVEGAKKNVVSDADANGVALFLSVVMGLLDNLSTLSDAIVANGFAQPVSGTAHATGSHATMWHLLSALVTDVLLPWARGSIQIQSACASSKEPNATSSRPTPSPMLTAAAVFRLAQRGCSVTEAVLAQSQAACNALVELLSVLLGPTGLELWLQPSAGKLDSTTATSDDPSSSTTTRRSPWEIFQESQGSIKKFEHLLAKYDLKAELLGASIACTQSSAFNASGCSDFGLASLLQAYGGRCSIPSAFRWWGDICELACGAAVDLGPPVQLWLPMWQPLHGERRRGASSAHAGCWSPDAHFLGTPAVAHVSAVRWAAAQIYASQQCEPETLEDLRCLVDECSKIPLIQANMHARVLATESFDGLIRAAGGQAFGQKESALGKKAGELLISLSLNLTGHLGEALQHLDLFWDHAIFFSRLIRLATNLLALPPHVSAIVGPSDVLSPFSFRGCNEFIGDDAKAVHNLLAHETPTVLGLVRQLNAALHACSAGLGHSEDLPPRSSALISGAAFYKGHGDAVLAMASLLMLLVPALRHPPKSQMLPPNFGDLSQTSSSECVSLLSELLQVIAELVDNMGETESREAFQLAGAPVLTTRNPTTVSVEKEDPGAAGPAGGCVARVGGSLTQTIPGVTLLQSPEDAMARCAAETQERALDHLLRSGFSALLMALAERAVAALRSREGALHDQQRSILGPKSCSVLRGALLPRLLSCSYSVFSSTLDRRAISLGMTAIGSRPAITAPIWDRAVEAAWACQLDSVLSVLFAMAQSTAGAVMLAEQRVFTLLAYCQLFHAAVLPADASGQFPAAYAWPRNFQRQRVGLGAAAPWRRPLHESWCRTLLLVATLLSSAPQLLSEATVFLEVFAPRFRYLFHSGVQSGHMAMLEEATAACRILALMAHRCGLAETLLGDAATQALLFIVGTCLTDLSAPLEVFVPVSAAERLGAGVEKESEAVPAEVPSVFHQRVQYLALDLVRSLLLALLRVVSTPTWMSNASAWASSSPWSSSARSQAPRGWPTTASILGLRPQVHASIAIGNSDEHAGPQRLWAAVMDMALEGARRIFGILDALSAGQRSALLFVNAEDIPLSLAIATLEPQASDTAATLIGSPGDFHLSPPRTPISPGPLGPLTPPTTAASPSRLGMKRKPGDRLRERDVRYKYMALRPDSWIGGQLMLGIAPEYTTLQDLRKLCGSSLEMACTLLCHYCQVTRSSIMTSADRSAPATTVLHGLLSFLLELRSSSLFQSSAIDNDTNNTKEYLWELDEALRSGQQLGAASELPANSQSALAHGSSEAVLDFDA